MKRFTLMIVLMALVIFTASAGTYTNIVRTWNANIGAFTSALMEGTPTGPSWEEDDAEEKASVVVGNTVYTLLFQSRYEEAYYGAPYLIRTTNHKVEAWNQNLGDWTPNTREATSIGNQFDDDDNDDGHSPAIAADSKGNIYMSYVYYDRDDDEEGVYLSRFNKSLKMVEIWDGSADAWTTTLSDADDAEDDIDVWRDSDGTPHSVQLAINSDDDVFITYLVNDGNTDNAYLTFYDSSEEAILFWDRDDGDADNGGNPGFDADIADGQDAADVLGH